MKKLSALLITFCLASSAYAANWQMVGARSMGMGGTGVATAQGGYAQYYNPALLAVKDGDIKHNTVAFGVGIQGETTSATLEVARKLMNMSDRYKKLVNDMNSGYIASVNDLQTVFEGMTDINNFLKNDTGALFNANAGIGFKFGHFGVSVNSLGSIATTPIVDRTNILLNNGTGINFVMNTSTPTDPSFATFAAMLQTAIQNADIAAELNTVINGTGTNAQEVANILTNTLISATGGNAAAAKPAIDSMIANMDNVAELIKGITTTGLYSDNQTRVMAEMAVFSEAALGYGFNLFHGVSLGASVKVIEGTTAQTGIFVLEDEFGFGGIMKDAWGNKKFSTNWGVDVGALVNFSDLFQGQVLFNPQVGITAKNINSPKFKRPDAPTDWTLPWNTDDYELKPQVRAGASINPAERVTVTVDLDINKNETTLKDYKSQQLAAGVEILVKDDVMFKLPIRFGINKNLAESSAPMYFTAGFATLGHDVGFEMAASIGDGTEKINGNNLPNAFGLSMNFTVAF